MVRRDSLGVPLEPEDEKVTGVTDWRGESLHEEDSVYITEDGLVREEDVSEYWGFIYPAPMPVYEVLEGERGI